jgi:hypothetical protein
MALMLMVLMMMMMMMLWCVLLFPLETVGMFVLGRMAIQFGVLCLREAQLHFPSRSISTCLPPAAFLFLSAASGARECLFPPL